MSDDEPRTEVVPTEKVEMVLAFNVFGGLQTDDEGSAPQPIVIADVVTCYSETYEHTPPDALSEMVHAAVEGTDEDPRIMRRRLAFPLAAVEPAVRRLRQAEAIAVREFPGG